MKILKTSIATIALAMCAAFSSCSDDPQNQIIVPVEPDETEGIDVTAIYYGDYNENNTGNFGLNFLTAGMEWDDFDETYIGPGSLFAFELNSDLAANPDLAKITPGTYTFDAAETYEHMTFTDATLTEYAADGTQTVTAVSGGTLEVSVTPSGMYQFEGTFALENGNTYNFTYNGYIRFLNRTGEGQMSNLTSNVEVKGLTQGAVIYWGETFTETSDYVSVILAGPDYDLLQNLGNSPALNLGLNVTPGSTSIPDGTYNVINANEADDYDTFTALSGVFESTYGGYFGTWYFDKSSEAAMLTGTVKVTSAGKNYTFEVNLADGYGHTVTGTYTGTLATLE